MFNKELLMSVRKNFIFDDETAEHLEKLAKRDGKTQTQVVKDLIEDEYKEISVKEKLEALYSFAGSMPDAFVGKSIQSIKASMDV
jgi:predicted DNA-binding protein